MKESYEKIVDYDWKGSPTRIRMPLGERAKIFMPFAALKGFAELIKKTEEEAEQEVEGMKKV